MCSAQFVLERKELGGQTCIFLLYTVTKSFPEPIYYIIRSFILMGKATGRGAGHSLVSIAEMKDGFDFCLQSFICLHDVIFNSAQESFYILYNLLH
jgi:hypothetical protein